MLKLLNAVGVAAAITLAATSSALAADAPPAPDTTLTGYVQGTNNYIFRGISQTANASAGQAGIDLTYKLFYAGAFISNLDFGKETVAPFVGKNIANTEIDVYGGIKFPIGAATLDLGIITYNYPYAFDNGSGTYKKLNYIEGKASISGKLAEPLTVTGTVFYSPTFTNDEGGVTTLEGGLSYDLPKWGSVSPNLSALVGYQFGGNQRFKDVTANGASNYTYYNAGATFGFGDRFSVDLRYWNTSISNTGDFCTGATFQCGALFSGTAKVTF